MCSHAVFPSALFGNHSHGPNARGTEAVLSALLRKSGSRGKCLSERLAIDIRGVGDCQGPLETMRRAAVDFNSASTIVLLDGRSAYDTISHAAFLRSLHACRRSRTRPLLWTCGRKLRGGRAVY